MSYRHFLNCFIVAVAGFGCHRPDPTPAESPDRVAARTFELAQNLEKEHKTKEAFAAYRQISQQFPSSPYAKKAADRIGQAQKDALRKRK
jgi:TolA-binding protein